MSDRVRYALRMARRVQHAKPAGSAQINPFIRQSVERLDRRHSMHHAYPQKTKSDNRSEAIGVLLMGGASLIGLAFFALFRMHSG